jgi:hypothetical protein
VWGCRDLHPWYDRVVADGAPIGEAWLTGRPVLWLQARTPARRSATLFAEAPESLLGSSAPRSQAGGPNASPLLIKVIFRQRKTQRPGASGRRDGAKVW